MASQELFSRESKDLGFPNVAQPPKATKIHLKVTQALLAFGTSMNNHIQMNIKIHKISLVIKWSSLPERTCC